MEILLLLLLLQVKHWYADFKIQTYMQTVKKGVWLDPIGISHTVDHVWCSLVVLLPFCLFSPVALSAVLTAVVLEGIAHYIIDYTKVKYGCKDNTKPLFWNQFGLDQLAHQVCYLLMAVYLLNLI
jgi:hypothetical protein